MTDLLVRGAEAILSGGRGADERASGDIRVRGGRITAIGALAPEPGEAVVDASGCVVVPGLISTHHHLFQSVLKAVPEGMDLALEGWLRTVAYRHWHKIDQQALVVAATIGMTELLLSGCTTVADHHFLFSDSYDFDPADILFATARRLGLRLVLCRGGATRGRSFDIPGTFPMPTESLDVMLARVERLAARWHDPSPDARTRIVLAPTTPSRSLDEGELRVVAQAARAMGLMLHGHLSETANCVRFIEDSFGMKPVHWLARHDWLGRDVWLAHLVHVDAEEIALLAQTGTGMAHCPQSNCRLGSGIAPADALDRLGGRVSLGVDGAASNESADMVSEMHNCFQVHRAAKGPDAVRAQDVLRWATAGGADVLNLPALGRVAVGKTADLAIFPLDHPRFAGLHDRAIAPVVGGGIARPRDVLLAGRHVVRDYAIPGLDLSVLAAQAAQVVGSIAA